MFENGPDDRRVLDAADDPHGALTFRTDQRIDFVYLLNQSRPVPPEGLLISLRFEDAGKNLVSAFLLPFPPQDVAVVSVGTHHLLAPVRDVGAHGRRPFHRGEYLCPFAVLGHVDDLPLLIQVGHPLLGE